MVRVSFKLAIRHLLRERSFSLMNLGGLAIALAAFILIVQFVYDEMSYDQQVMDGEEKYRLLLDVTDQGEQQHYATNFYPLAPILQEVIPDLAEFNRFYYLDRHAIVTIGQEKYNEKDVVFADPNFLEFFGFEPTSQSLTEDGAYLSEEMAAKYFGGTDPIGQSLKVNMEDGEHLFKVGGVFRGHHGNSHLRPQLVLPLRRLTDDAMYQEFKWVWNFFGTYFTLGRDADLAGVERQINAQLGSLIPERVGRKYEVRLQPLHDIHLEPGLRYDYGRVANGLVVNYMAIAALFILVLAYLNFINITSVRNSLRVKEVGVRRILGSRGKHFVVQFLMESLLINGAALVLSLTLVQLFVPLTGLMGVDLELTPVWSLELILGLLLVVVIGALISGAVPIWLMRSIGPREVLRSGLSRSLNGLGLRRVLVGSQFTITLVMIASVLVMRSQLNHMISKDKGITLDHIMVINGPRASEVGMNLEAYQAVLNQLEALNGVQSASVSNSVPGIWMGNNMMVSPAGDREEIPVQSYRTSSQYFESYNVEILAGRVFTDQVSDQQSVVINQSAFDRLGLNSYSEVLNREVAMGRGKRRVIGVVGDYHHFDLKRPIYPTIIFPFTRNAEYFSVKLKQGASQSEAIAGIKAIWEAAYPADPYDYFFQDNLFDRGQAFELAVVRIFGLFTVLALIIAALGLIGLATFVAHLKTKEIGVRKVLGASLLSLLYLLVRDFLFLILFGLVIGMPIIYLAMNAWLDDYAYRIDFPWWVVPVSGTVLMVLMGCTVSYHTLKAALSNPVKALRYE